MRRWSVREERWDNRVKFIASYAGHVDLFATERDPDADVRNGVWSSEMTDEEFDQYMDRVAKYTNQPAN